MLPARLPKRPKRESRWRSPAHLSFVRGFACASCGSGTNIEAAHVRINSGAGVGAKPSDFRAVSLCRDCHQRQHMVGERTFWGDRDVEALIDEFCKASPKAREIKAIRDAE